MHELLKQLPQEVKNSLTSKRISHNQSRFNKLFLFIFGDGLVYTLLRQNSLLDIFHLKFYAIRRQPSSTCLWASHN